MERKLEICTLSNTCEMLLEGKYCTVRPYIGDEVKYVKECKKANR
jgi:hypothetical protein